MPIRSDESLDTILGGALSVVQPRDGYRFSVDSILLARFATARSRDRVLELGAGCGVISLVIAAIARPRETIALEIQPRMAQLAARNARDNGFPNLHCMCADIRTAHIAGVKQGSFDLVVCNPPFHACGAGRQSANRSRRQARGDAGASLAEFTTGARRYVRNGGRVATIFAAARCAELISTLRANRLEPKRIRFVHPRMELPASSVMIEARANGGIEVTIEPPLVLEERAGVYTEEVRNLLERV
ncbi:MAG TPA: methyltransferase [Candidatus Binataceae bacterium]|nr:methyltransferase [Candidatus Binataceae bacterium]